MPAQTEFPSGMWHTVLPLLYFQAIVYDQKPRIGVLANIAESSDENSSYKIIKSKMCTSPFNFIIMSFINQMEEKQTRNW